MGNEDELAKAQAGQQGKDAKTEQGAEEKPEQESEQKPRTDSGDTPQKPRKGEGEGSELEKLQQKVTTTEGLLRQAQSKAKELEQRGYDFDALKLSIESMTDTMNLVADAISQMAVDNEELSQRIHQSRQEREANAKKVKAYSEIMQIAGQAGLTHESPELAHARDAFVKGDFEGAKQQTFLTVIGKLQEGKLVPKEPEAKPAENKPAEKEGGLPVITSGSSIAEDWRDLPSIEKIKRGAQKAKEQQG